METRLRWWQLVDQQAGCPSGFMLPSIQSVKRRCAEFESGTNVQQIRRADADRWRKFLRERLRTCKSGIGNQPQLEKAGAQIVVEILHRDIHIAA